MTDKHDKDTLQGIAAPLLVVDRVIAPMLGVSVQFLQKDRRGAQRIPYIKLGDRCLYDPADALAAVKAMTVGGPRGCRGRTGGTR